MRSTDWFSPARMSRSTSTSSCSIWPSASLVCSDGELRRFRGGAAAGEFCDAFELCIRLLPWSAGRRLTCQYKTSLALLGSPLAPAARDIRRFTPRPCDSRASMEADLVHHMFLDFHERVLGQ